MAPVLPIIVKAPVRQAVPRGQNSHCQKLRAPQLLMLKRQPNGVCIEQIMSVLQAYSGGYYK